MLISLFAGFNLECSMCFITISVILFIKPHTLEILIILLFCKSYMSVNKLMGISEFLNSSASPSNLVTPFDSTDSVDSIL